VVKPKEVFDMYELEIEPDSDNEKIRRIEFMGFLTVQLKYYRLY